MRLQGNASALLFAASALTACADNYSQDPKVAAAYAAAAAGLTVAQAVAQHQADNSAASFAPDPGADLRLLRDYAMDAINRARAERSLPALTSSPVLSEFAQRGSEWLEDDHQPKHHLLSDARCARCGESQGNARGEEPAPAQIQIDLALRAMLANDAEARANLLSASWRFVGVGITNPGGEMYLTIDLSEGAL